MIEGETRASEGNVPPGHVGRFDEAAEAGSEGASGGFGTRLECPRCGHDVRGETLAWVDACPLEGRCGECGLDFAWRMLLGRRGQVPSWSVEGSGFWSRAIRRVPRQILMTVFRPDRVLREFGMEQRRRPGRLACCLLPILILLVLIPFTRSFLEGRSGGLGVGAALATAARFWDGGAVVVRGAAPPAAPGQVWSLQGTRSWFQLSTSRVVDMDPLDASTVANYRGPTGAIVPYVRADGVEIAIVAGNGDGSVPTFTQPAAEMPIQIVMLATTPDFTWREWLVALATIGAPIMAVPVVAAIAFLLLPIVRRRARVRSGHVVRLTLLGLMPAFVAGAALALLVLQFWPSVVYGSLVGTAVARGGNATVAVTFGVLIVFVVVWIPTLAWTWLAASRHLRLARPLPVTLSVSTVAALAVTSVWTIAQVTS